MLIESALGIVALIAVGMVFDKYTGGAFGGPPAAFAAGIATMFSDEDSSVYNTNYALLTLAVSVFALTSLDTGTRLGRFLFSELFLKEDEKTWKDATGARKFLAHPMVGYYFPCCWLYPWWSVIKPDLGTVRSSQPASCRYRSHGSLHMAWPGRKEQ